MRTEFGYPRTDCACQVCVTNCKHMPGFLIPADLDRMIPPEAHPFAWAAVNLLASPGALVIKDGQKFRIPTLVPATKTDGSCIHLIDDRCNIHTVSPFGCAFFDCGPERGQLSQYGLIEVMRAWANHPSLYSSIWHHLDFLDKRQQSPDALRQTMGQ